MPLTATAIVPMRTVSESNGRDHWAKKAARVKKQRDTVGWTLFAKRPLPSLPAIVKLTRVSPRLLDDDNLRSALKATRDEVAKVYRVDDRDPQIVWEYEQIKATKTHQVIIYIQTTFEEAPRGVGGERSSG